MKVEDKYQKLCANLRSLESLVVAFSGGVDSTFLLWVAKEVLREKVVAFTVDTPYHARWEVQEAVELAQQLKVKHIVKCKPEILPEIENNPPHRCYLCKKVLFGEMLNWARENGFAWVAEGTNVDDQKDYRPGLRALQELGIKSPLLEAGFSKQEIRSFSKRLGLPTWDKPVYACLLTRVPYGERVRKEDLAKIEQAELYMKDLGFRGARVRMHTHLARIEVLPEEREKLFDIQLWDAIAKNVKKMGFKYVTLDLEGYRTGSLNEVL